VNAGFEHERATAKRAFLSLEMNQVACAGKATGMHELCITDAHELVKGFQVVADIALDD